MERRRYRPRRSRSGNRPNSRERISSGFIAPSLRPATDRRYYKRSRSSHCDPDRSHAWDHRTRERSRMHRRSRSRGRRSSSRERMPSMFIGNSLRPAPNCPKVYRGYVTGLPQSWSSSDLSNHSRQYGLTRYSNVDGYGGGLVEFADQFGANAALADRRRSHPLPQALLLEQAVSQASRCRCQQPPITFCRWAAPEIPWTPCVALSSRPAPFRIPVHWL
jgi:hypothetical protein